MESNERRLLEGVPHSKRVVVVDRIGVIQRILVDGTVGQRIANTIAFDVELQK